MKRTLLLIATAAALVGCGEEGRWTTHRDGTVTDNTTGLTWQRCFTHQKYNKSNNTCDDIDLKKADFAVTPSMNAEDSTDKWIIPSHIHLASIRTCTEADKENPAPIKFTKTGDKKTDELQVDIVMAPCMETEGQLNHKIPADIFPFANSAKLIVADSMEHALDVQTGVNGRSISASMFTKVNRPYEEYGYATESDRSFYNHLNNNRRKLSGHNDLKRNDFPLDRVGFLLVKQSEAYLKSEAHAMNKYTKSERIQLVTANNDITDPLWLGRYKDELAAKKADAIKKHCSQANKPSFCPSESATPSN